MAAKNSDVRERLQAIAAATNRRLSDVANDALMELMKEQTFDKATERRRNAAMSVLFDILEEESKDENLDV